LFGFCHFRLLAPHKESRERKLAGLKNIALLYGREGICTMRNLWALGHGYKGGIAHERKGVPKFLFLRRYFFVGRLARAGINRYQVWSIMRIWKTLLGIHTMRRFGIGGTLALL
jgi:hypothetical protein